MNSIEDIINVTAIKKEFFELKGTPKIKISDEKVKAVVEVMEKELMMKAAFLDEDAIVFIEDERIRHVTARFFIEENLRENSDVDAVAKRMSESMKCFQGKKIDLSYRT